MIDRLALDFGTSNTLLTFWNETKQESTALNLTGFSYLCRQGDEQIPLIPSLIHFSNDHQQWIGQQVLDKDLTSSPQTFRWMKRYISNRSPSKLIIGSQIITPAHAAQQFIHTLLAFAQQEYDISKAELVVTSPVEAYEHYENWLAKTVEAAGFSTPRIIDEPTAAALGYGAHILPGNVYLIFDFGGGTMDAAVVMMEKSEGPSRKCRVLGKAGKDIGGISIDQWLYEDILHKNKQHINDPSVQSISHLLLAQCATLKENLSSDDNASLTVQGANGLLVSAEYSRLQFDDLLDRRQLFRSIQQTIQSAIKASQELGYDEENILSVFMVGGSCQIPSVQRAIRQMFGAERVNYHFPINAVARGAAALAAGVDIFDHIQHNYAIRYVDPTTGKYNFRNLVSSGTPYPTQEPVASLQIKASHHHQSKLGLAIFETGCCTNTPPGSVELFFDSAGNVRMLPVSPQELEKRTSFWMNENNPTFLEISSPVQQGQPCFEVEFKIDQHKRLTITARNLLNGAYTHIDHPVIRLI